MTEKERDAIEREIVEGINDARERMPGLIPRNAEAVALASLRLTPSTHDR